MAFNKAARRQRIRYKIRKKISGTKERPRLAIFRSNKYIYAQLIDDNSGHTLVSASSKEFSESTGKVDDSKGVGKLIAERASALGVDTIVFDRSGYLYHGRVKSLAEGAREAGLNF
ncbi:MAG: 50S ribosomal protein L18 [Chitinophagales bacterium]